VEADLVAIAVGLAVSFIAFLSRQLLLPPLRRLGAWFRRPHDCRRLLAAARSELETNIERLASDSLASRVVQDDGTERVFYCFGSAYSGLPVPSFQRFAGSLWTISTSSAADVSVTQLASYRMQSQESRATTPSIATGSEVRGTAQ
jgi:hypothetical protein